MALNLLLSGQIKKRFFNLKQGIEKIGLSVTNKAALILKDEIKSEIELVNAVASEDLIKSIEIDYVAIQDQFYIEVGSNAPQAYWIEFGRKPSSKMPPIDRIYDWMIDKGIEGTIRDAFKIARKIKNKGYEPREPFTKAYYKALPKIEKYIGTVLNTELKIND